MSDHLGFGWMLFILGSGIACIGLIWVFAPSIVPWLGRLPGDIHVEGENGNLFFPLTTCILLSLAFSALVWMIRLFRG